MSFSSDIGSGLAVYGRFEAVMGAIVGVIVALILIIVGWSVINSPFKSVAKMLVTKVSSCTKSENTQNGNTSVSYNCVIDVSFTPPASSTAVSVSNVNYTSPVPLAAGAFISLRYEPTNPSDVKQGIAPDWGYAMLGGGVLIAAASVGMAMLTFESKRFAQVEGVVSAANTASRLF